MINPKCRQQIMWICGFSVDPVLKYQRWRGARGIYSVGVAKWQTDEGSTKLFRLAVFDRKLLLTTFELALSFFAYSIVIAWHLFFRVEA